MQPQSLEQSIAKFRSFDLDGGQLALDFTNTVDWRNTPKEYERLNGYSDLLGWGLRVGMLDRREAELLAQKAGEASGEAREVLAGARELRELLFRVFDSVIREDTLDPADWDRFNRELGMAMSRGGIQARGGGFAWAFERGAGGLDFFRAPVLKAASDLLTEGNLSRLKRCGAPDCQWLFLDTSRNNSRRWCDMQSCGNRAKARRHYQRTRRA
jgi:predicted RNA-binding Zn ribbon-like protein